MLTQLKTNEMYRGKVVANQFTISGYRKRLPTTNKHSMIIEGEAFQSYNSTIALKPYYSDRKARKAFMAYLDKQYWNYSRTTGRYRNRFLGESIAETRKRIKSGEYKLVDLN